MAVLARKDASLNRLGNRKFWVPRFKEIEEVLSDYAEWTSDQTFGEIASGRRVS